jgi:pimeloyl-ACP methyl ester carboxylesterase
MKMIVYGLVFLPFLSTVLFGQTHPIPYGNNPATGKYYTVHGIKMYAEVYGKGKPLLMIHGNGGSIDKFAVLIPFFSKKYKVIAVDSRSQGKSLDDRDSLSFADMILLMYTGMNSSE